MDWVKFLSSAVIGLVSLSPFSVLMKLKEYSFLLSSVLTLLLLHFLQAALVSSLKKPIADIKVFIALISTLVCYCAKTYFT